MSNVKPSHGTLKLGQYYWTVGIMPLKKLLNLFWGQADRFLSILSFWDFPFIQTIYIQHGSKPESNSSWTLSD